MTRSHPESLLSLMALVLLSPLLLFLAAAIFCALGRPILFRQQRSGASGKPFEMVKFRTMTNATDASGNLLPDDDRLPAFGRFLRRTRLDELPELWNIARGDMRLVGPRPLLPETIRAFGKAGETRGLVPPGLTGWAQVNGNTRLTPEEKLRLDLWYISHRSLALDLEILARTLAVILFGESVNRTNVEKALARHSDRGS